MQKIFRLIVIILIFGWISPLDSRMTGGDFEIYADHFTYIDNFISTSSKYALMSSGGEGYAGTTTGGKYILRGGFRAMEKGILKININPSTVNLGTLSDTEVASTSAIMTIHTDSMTGYIVSATEDGNLRSGANDIDDVSDGSVTAGSEEYGIRTFGTDGLLLTDSAVSGTVFVAQSDGIVNGRDTEISFLAGIATSTPDGSYSHIITLTVTVNP